MINNLSDLNGGADVAQLPNEYINFLLLAVCKIGNISSKQLQPFIPAKTGLRNTFVFKCLLNVYVYPRQTKTCYSKTFHTCQSATANAIEYLVTLGLIQLIGRPRLITPFQTYKVDNAYKVTLKGGLIIKNVLDSFELIY